jgi:hypothetical protein
VTLKVKSKEQAKICKTSLLRHLLTNRENSNRVYNSPCSPFECASEFCDHYDLDLCSCFCDSSEIECEDEILADIQLTQQHNTMDVVSESAVIEDDADEVIVYDDEDEEDGLAYNSGMQLVTEKLLGVKVLPYLSKPNLFHHFLVNIAS